MPANLSAGRIRRNLDLDAKNSCRCVGPCLLARITSSMSAPSRSARSATMLAYEILTARNEFEACLISSALLIVVTSHAGQRRIRAARCVHRAIERSLQHRAVNILQLPLGGIVFHAHDDAVGVQKILDCRALAQEFRVRCNAERYTGSCDRTPKGRVSIPARFAPAPCFFRSPVSAARFGGYQRAPRDRWRSGPRCHWAVAACPRK